MNDTVVETSATPTIVLVEDDLELAALVAEYLESKQFQVIQIHEGLSAVDQILNIQPCAVVLDLMLPGKDGITICREIRFGYSGPVMMLTASDDVFDQVTGLEIGADDYVQKPVEPRVLLARLRALLRRTQDHQPSVRDNAKRADLLRVNELVINRSAMSAKLAGVELQLSNPEYEVLLALAEEAGTILTRDELFMRLKNYDYDGQSRFIDITVSHIRKKLGDNAETYLKTIRGKGYMITL